MIRGMVLVLAAAMTVHAQSVEERVRRAQDRLRTSQGAREARGILEGAAALCDTTTDPACALAYDWLGMAIEHENRDLDTLRLRVEPLYAKALEREESQPSALTLELDGRALQRLGEADKGGALLNRASALRAQAVAAMAGVPLPASDPPRRVGGGVLPPRLTNRMEPSYTDEARLLLHSGTVVLALVVGTDGVAHDIQLKRGLGFGLDEQAVLAIQRWKFEPATKDGQPVNAIAQVEVNFRLL